MQVNTIKNGDKMSKTRNEENDQFTDLANRAARSSIAVIDTISQRGGFKGEELSTIGQLRDQCVQIVTLYESKAVNKASQD